ncbi:MAG: pyruvate dehydrogenase (acetyl-transferring) E1 component subunit alpha [Candidatus Cloacimonetes bacterium HGW-Cloacimonetes-1]|jgi:pyruvate dehydrogenase E1 component alpha subunit|nr:MAG: pyruvate dehydrogenase (acetyl-transferring) E1 component subunit alpha [Candidatus Cloacimonetes bacterium HGW-Cloacimonetes-1]
MFNLKTLDKFKPIDDKTYQVIDNDGKVIIKDWIPDLKDEEIVQAYKDLLFERTADFMAVSYQRQGRMFTYPPNLGQEAIHIASGKVIQPEDWLVPAFRELGAWLAKGVSLWEIFLYFKGHEDGSKFLNAKRMLPISVPIASQLLHAVGIGYAMKYQGEKAVAFAYVGDGGTSEGDFHEALNFAAVWDVPVVFVVQNNRFAISVPLKMQTRSLNLAVKGVAYDVKSIAVDGNDFFAMHDVLSFAREFVLKENKPFLIEAKTYRQGAHTTSDDPTRYRTKDEEDEWALKDPLKRLQSYLISKKLWDPSEDEKLIAQYKKKIDSEFEKAEAYPEYKLDDVFDYMYENLPDELKRQKNNYQNYLNHVGGVK